jgi:hypothetical protein
MRTGTVSYALDRIHTDGHQESLGMGSLLLSCRGHLNYLCCLLSLFCHQTQGPK